jgi:hypothetical protein
MISQPDGQIIDGLYQALTLRRPTSMRWTHSRRDVQLSSPNTLDKYGLSADALSRVLRPENTARKQESISISSVN